MEDGSAGTSALAATAVCSFRSCDRSAVYAFEGDVASLCEVHQPISPYDALQHVCHARGCVNRVSHGRERDSMPSSCAAHVLPGMVQMRGVPCEFPCCRFAPLPAQQGDGNGRRCKAHMTSPLLAEPKPAPDATATHSGEKRHVNSSGVVQETTSSPAVSTATATTTTTTTTTTTPTTAIPTTITRKRSSSSKRLRGRGSKAAALAAAAAEVERTDMEAAKKHATAGGEGGGGGSSGGGGGGRQGATLTCESPLCNKNPSFGYRGQTRRRFCKLHAEPGMVNVYYRYCGADGDRCPERASFEADGKLRCLQHREPGMRPRNKICQVEGGGCTRQSSFGVVGGKPVLCTVHKKPGMVQVRTKTCRHPGCDKIPSYGYPCKSREFCKPHALEGMVYSAGSRCRFRGCELPGVFNYPWSARGGSFCSSHKEDGMVDITPKRCESVGCKYAANFGDKTQRTRRFCARHKLGGMQSYQELWPKPDEKATKAIPSPTNAEKALAGELAATAAATAAAVAASSSPSFSSGQPRKPRNEDAAGPAKKARAHKPPPPPPPPPPGGQPATATASGPSASFQRPENRGLAGVHQLNLPASASASAFDLLPRPPQQLAATAPRPGAGASASPAASSAIDLDFLADAAASATPTSGALGGHQSGGWHGSLAGVGGLRGSEAPFAQATAGTSTQAVGGDSVSAAAAAAAATNTDDDSPLPWSPWPRDDLNVGGLSTGTGAAAAASSDTAAAAVAGATAADPSGGVSMPPISARPTSVSLDDDVSMSLDFMGPGPLEDGGTEEDKFLASLVNSVDPANPKTLRVRGAMLSRLKRIGRAKLA
eukprot:g6575.t2